MRTLLLLFIIISSTSGYGQCTRTAPFQDANYVVNGTVTITYLLDGSKSLGLNSDFSTSSGPDLHVYLANTSSINTSGGVNPPGTVDLGLLTNVNGASNFTMPSNIQIDDYNFVIIQCKQFNAQWGFAALASAVGTDCASLSVDENDLNTVSFYPNPTRNKISFNLNIPNDINVTIYNYSGLKILQKQINFNDKDILLNDLSSGMYVMELISENKKSIRKLIVN